MQLWRQKWRHLQLASRRPGEPTVWVVPIWVHRPENQDCWWCKFQSKSEGRWRSIAQLADSRVSSPLFSLFWSVQASKHIMWGPLILERANCFAQMFISRNTLTDIPRIIFNQISGHLMTQSSWHIQLTSTGSKYILPACAWTLFFLILMKSPSSYEY